GNQWVRTHGSSERRVVMGCSYLNCSVSGLPIGPGTKGVLWWLTPQRSNDTWVYPWDAWKFVSLPFMLRADDYGFSTYFTDEEKVPRKQTAWRYFWGRLWAAEGGTLDDWFAKTHNETVAIAERVHMGGYTKIHPITYTVVRQDVYDWVRRLLPKTWDT